MLGNRQFSSAAVIVKEGSAEALLLAQAMDTWLKERGINVFIGMHGDQNFFHSLPSVDIAFSLGGDGTFVSVARKLLERKVPLAGVNFGRVGFLTKISPDSWQESLSALLKTGMHVESRMALGYRHSRNGKTLGSGMVINDVVITRGEFARLVNLDLRVNGAPLMVLRSDGVILSTPTGSSGYSRSSGGPLLFPSLNAYVVTAICPYLGSFPPIVLEDSTRFSVTAGKGGARLYLSLDGQETHQMDPGDAVEVFGVPDAFRVVEPDPEGYFKKLRTVGFIQGSH